jgi:DMSO/TMAO reductase YedYZ molybdopterin-dependent catalytic subunit
MNIKTPNIEKKPSSLRYYQDGPPCHIDLDKWQLKVSGLVPEEIFLSYNELLTMPQITESRRMFCVCNWSIRRTWTGVLLEELLLRAKVPFKKNIYVKQVSIGTSEKGKYDSTIPLADAIERRALIIHSVDGSKLTLEQGFPIRLIDFGLYGYKGVKGIEHLILTKDFATGHWERAAGYDKSGKIKKKKYWCVDLRKHQFVGTDGEVTDF